MKPEPPITPAIVEALLNRSKQLVLTQAWLGLPHGLAAAQGAFGELFALLNSYGPAHLAEQDFLMGGYQPLAGFQAAWAALPIDAKYFSMAEMQEFLRAHGVEVPHDAVGQGNVHIAGQFKNSVIATVNGHDEHGTLGAELDDGSGLQSGAPVGAAIVQQGGAA